MPLAITLSDMGGAEEGKSSVKEQVVEVGSINTQKSKAGQGRDEVGTSKMMAGMASATLQEFIR